MESRGMIQRAHEAKRHFQELNIAPEIDQNTGKYKPLWYEFTTIRTHSYC